MILIRKILHIFALVFLVVSLASCKEECVSADEFDTHAVVIESNPVKDGVYGYYDGQTGGQRAAWHNTGLRANGSPLLIQISGSWVSLQGDTISASARDDLERCNFCAKRYDNTSPNCICYSNQESIPEKGLDGNDLNVDCSLPANQEDPAKCSCSIAHGAATDYGTYHFPLNILNKNESIKNSDEQSNCKYDRGMGAYISLWGSSGAATPIRAYHLFSEEEICNVIRNSQGECLDSEGKDVTRYVFRSANGAGLLKDDQNGNVTIDYNTGNDEYHRPNEKLKTIMHDSYYSDNAGQYNIRILGGVGDENEPGLLEFLVSLIEDVLLGEINAEGEREGGIIEFMYKSIIKDSGFALFVQVSLALYITLFGAAHLFGVAEISNKKEIMNRVLKISLIMFFISDNSWYFYNKIVVGFFKDSMDYVVSLIMDLQDSNFDPTSMIHISQMDRANDISSATRFSYIDLVIRNLMSYPTSVKIWGLFFDSIAGFIYIPVIYALIFGFIYVMLHAASMYVSNLIKIIFVLSLGPVFMIFTLFSKTSQMFKNWLAFLGGRSMEVIVIFTVLYLFVTLLDTYFTDMLYYSVCGVNKGIGPIKFIVLEIDLSRSFMEWILKFLSIGALLFMTYMVLQQLPAVVSSIVSIGGANSGSASNMAGGLMSGAMGLTKMAAGGLGSVAAGAARYGVRGATHVLRKTGIAGAIESASKYSPIPTPRTLYRNAIIDGAIKKAKNAAGNLTGKERDRFIRDNANKELQLAMQANPNKMAFAGVDMKAMEERFDKKLVKNPLKKFLKEEAGRMKRDNPNNIKFGKEAQDELKKRAMGWAEKNLGEGSDRVAKYLAKSGSLNDLIKDKTTLSSYRAHKQLTTDESAQRYLRHLTNKQAENFNKKQQASKSQIGAVGNALSRGYHYLRRDKANNPLRAERAFLRKKWNDDNDRTWLKNRSFLLPSQMNENRRDVQKSILMDDLAKGVNLGYTRHRLYQLAQKGEGTDLSKASSNQDVFDITARIAADNFKKNKVGDTDEATEHRRAMKQYIKDAENKMSSMSEAERLEESARLMKLSGMMGGSTLANTSSQHLQTVASITDPYINGGVNAGNIDDAKASAGLVAEDFKVQFGQPLTDALLKEPDVGLKASNVALGVDSSAGQVSSATLSALKVSKNQVEVKIRLDKMNKQIKQYELEQLKVKQNAGENVTTDIKAAENEIVNYEREISRNTGESTRIDSEIGSNGG